MPSAALRPTQRRTSISVLASAPIVKRHLSAVARSSITLAHPLSSQSAIAAKSAPKQLAPCSALFDDVDDADLDAMSVAAAWGGAPGSAAETAAMLRDSLSQKEPTLKPVSEPVQRSTFRQSSFMVSMKAAKKYKIKRLLAMPTRQALRNLHALCASPIVSVHYLTLSVAENPAGLFEVARNFHPLHHLAANPHATGEMVAYLVGANPLAVLASDDMRRTPLHWLCASRSADLEGIAAMVNASVPKVRLFYLPLHFK